ncbi:MAG: glycosyltransferase family 39 protein [bacterium]|nr:glycosyltransferase family 39 protein [bacterium]
MNIDFLKNMKSEYKMFGIFLLVHLLVWTFIGMIRTVMPTDSLEGVYWGMFHDFGTPKHPPLAGWLTYLAYAPLKSDFCVYLLSQAFIVGGFIYIYRLARKFLDENKSMLAVILLEGCWCYSYVTGYYGFNPDVILLFTLPAITFYFHNCITTNKGSDWLKLGILVGFSFLNKYQTALIILPMLIWVLMFKREVFKNKFFYIAAFIATIIFLPHILWLIKYDFYPLMYFEGELTAPNWYHHITAPLMFFLMQIVAIAGSLAIFLVLKLKYKSPFKLPESFNKQDLWFILLIGLTPLAIHLLLGFYSGGTMRPRWGYEFWYMTGIMLFYFFPIEINKKEFVFTLKSAYILMTIVFLALGTLLAVEKNYRSRYPVATVYQDLKEIWGEKIDTPIKYVGGYIEWTLPLTIYGDNHPYAILDNHGYPDPWLSEDDIQKSGVMIIGRKKQDIVDYTKLSCPYLPEDYKITPVEYRFDVHNALGMAREYKIYYFIVPPIQD